MFINYKKTKLFIKSLIYFMILFFIFNFSFDVYKTINPQKKDDTTQFSYNFFKEPFKYFYFKRIPEVDKKYFWDFHYSSETIFLFEVINFNGNIFYRIIDSKKFKTDNSF